MEKEVAPAPGQCWVMDTDVAPSFFLQALEESAEGSHGELKVFVQHKEIAGKKGKPKMLVRWQIFDTMANMGIFLEEERKIKHKNKAKRGRYG